MTIPSITPTPISPPAPPPTRNDPDNFRARADAFVDWQADDFPDEIDAFIMEMNATITAMNAVSAQVDEDATATEQARLTTVGAVNFKGYWADLTGALNTPASVAHDGSLWLLTENLADVTAVEPTPANTEWFLVPEQFQVGDVAYLAAPKTNWLACDGATYLQNSYPTLYALIGQYMDLTSTVIGTPIISDNTEAYHIYDDDYLYFFGTASGDTTITRISKTDFTAIELELPAVPVSYLTQDDDRIYVQHAADAGNGNNCFTAILKSTFAIIAGTPVILLGHNSGVAVDGGVLYISGGPTSGDKFCAITISTWTVIAASISTATEANTQLYFTDGYVYQSNRIFDKSDWSSVDTGDALVLPVLSFNRAEDATYVYITHTYFTDTSVTRVKKSDGSRTSLETIDLGQVYEITIDDNYIYCAHVNAPFYSIYDKTAFARLTGVPTIPDDGRGIYVDNNYVYIAHSGSPYLTVIDKSDWSIVPNTPTLTAGASISADSMNVYIGHFGTPYFTVLGSTHDPATEFTIYNIQDAVEKEAKAYIKAV